MMAFSELYLLRCPACLDELGKQNQIPMTGISTPPYVIIANGDFNSPEKMRLKKLRAAGSLWDRFCRSIGAVAVNMPTAGMYEAMSRGTLDGVLYAVGGLKTHGLGDIAKQVIMLNSGSFRAGAMFTMNMDTWKALTLDERKAFLRATPRAAVRARRRLHQRRGRRREGRQGQEYPDRATRSGAAADAQRVRRGRPETDGEDRAGEAAPDRCGRVRRQLPASLYDKYEKLVQPLGNDETKLSELMYNEIYAKLDPNTFGMK